METKAELTALQFFTMSTCGEACWEAREEVCHCSCHGKNHGILRTGNRPKRTCKISGYWYELYEITDCTGHKRCHELREEDAKLHPEKYMVAGYSRPMVYYNSQPGDAFHLKMATESQRKWIELENCRIVGDSGEVDQYIIWKRIPPPVA